MLGTIVDRRLSTVFEQIARRHLRRQVPDPELRAKLTPDYTLGLQADHDVEHLLPGAHASRTPRWSPTPIARGHRARRSSPPTAASTRSTRSSGRPASSVFDHPGFAAVRGRDGKTLQEAWQGSPRAYLGTAVAGFPNLFLLVGPNSAGGYNSIIFSSEAHINYVAGCVREMDRSGVRHGRGPARGLRRLRPRDRPPARGQRLEPRRVRELVPGLERAQRDLVAGLHGAALASHAPLRPRQLHRRARLAARGPARPGCPYPGRVHRGRDRARRRAARHVLADAGDHSHAVPRVDWRQSTALGTPGAGSLEHGVRFPAAGHHFFTWDPILHRQPDRDWRRWGTDDLVRTTLRVLREFARRHPHAPRIGVGDLGLRHGGYFGPEVGGGIGHATHQNGLDVDVYYPRRIAASGRRSPSTRSTCGCPRRCVDLFVDAGRADDLRRPEPAAQRPAGRGHAARQPRQPPALPDRAVRSAGAASAPFAQRLGPDPGERPEALAQPAQAVPPRP